MFNEGSNRNLVLPLRSGKELAAEIARHSIARAEASLRSPREGPSS